MKRLTPEKTKEIWTEFNNWFLADRSKTCKSCGHTKRNEPEWEAQQQYISILFKRAIVSSPKHKRKK